MNKKNTYKNFYQLVLITNKHNQSIKDYLLFIKLCAEAEITAVQLREKYLSFKEQLSFGKKLKAILNEYGIPLIINDSLNLMQELNADGLHLGQTDGDPYIARTLLGENKIIGVSVNSLEELYIANNQPIDYVGIGAVFHTTNKQNIIKTWGLEGLREASILSKRIMIAIGGINTSNAIQVISAGAHGIATIGALHNVMHDVRALKNIIKRLKNYVATT